MTSSRPPGLISHLVDRAFARAAIRSGLQRNDPQLVKAGWDLLRRSFLAETEVSSKTPSQLMIDTLSERMTELLSQSAYPLREMAWVENLLERNGISISPRRTNPAIFSRDLFEGRAVSCGRQRRPSTIRPGRRTRKT